MNKYDANIKHVIDFWFQECKPKDWFKKDKKFDLLIEQRFLKLVENALQNKLKFWKKIYRWFYSPNFITRSIY